MAQGTVWFEEIRPSHLWLARWYVWRGLAVRYRHLHERAAAHPWLRARQADGTIQAVELEPLLFRLHNPSANLAYERVEPVMRAGMLGHGLLRSLTRLYGSDVVAAAFKKQLVTRLSQSFYDALVVERILPHLPASGALRVVFSQSVRAAWYAEHERFLGVERTRWTSSPWSRALGGAFLAMERALLIGLAGLGFARGLWQVLRGAIERPPIRRYDLAVAIVSPMRELANRIRSVDVLLDGKVLTRQQALFVPTVKVSPGQRRQLDQLGLAVAEPLSALSITAFLRLAAATGGFLRSCWTAPTWMLKAAAGLLFDYGRWQGFVERYRIGQFVTYADFGFRQIGRNILLKQAGTSTWYYQDSANYWCHFTPAGEPIVRVPQLGFLYYDVLVAWNTFIVRYLSAHPQLIGRYEVVGCLWSEHIRLIREGRLASDLPSRARQHGWSEPLKVVGVFPSWCQRRDEPATLEDGLAFLKGIERLLEDFPDIFVILKEKHPRGYFADHPILGGPDAAAIYRFLERLGRHPRCFAPGFETSASEVAAMSDLVISFPFTSTSYEPLGAGGKAVFYDPNAKHRGVPYDQFPGYVLHGYSELTRRVAELLHETTLAQHAAYLEREFRGRGEPLPDASGLSRFRALLVRPDAAEDRTGGTTEDVVEGPVGHAEAAA